MLSVFFFFFKQKTAYEMRISDWSSDVCSSDLATEAAARSGRRKEVLRLLNRGVSPRLRTTYGMPQGQRLHGLRHIMHAQDGGALRGRVQGEIGRASCRERVCQYV